MIGKTISHYKILEKLGEGGMGVVYKAEDTKLDRLVALKFISPQSLKSEEEKARFIQEAKAAAAINHANITTIHEIDEVENETFISMEYIEGESLRDKIESGPLKIEESLKIAIQIAEGLQEAHDKGIVHRDIKSANIMITEKGQVKIMDFGLAKLKGHTKLTKEGTTLGTVAYMSPEQAAGEEIDHRSDIWSLGMVLYEMITGQLPFKGEYDQAIMYSIMNDDPEPVTGLRTGVSMDLERFIHKALKKNSKERYQHTGDLLVDLKNLQKQPAAKITEQSKDIKEPIKSRSPKRWIPVVAGVLIVLIVAGYFALKKAPQPGEKEIQQTKSKESASVDNKWKNSIAVLPFTNISADKEQEYFCDGMTEDIITKLTYINDLKVISRTSVMRYKKTEKSIKDIGKELAVNNILEGSVRKEKNRIRITAQLIRVTDDAHLWAKNYDRNLESIFNVQDEVSKAIADSLEVTLTPETIKAFRDNQTQNMEAYENYLKGMHVFNTKYLHTFNEDDFSTAVRMLETALEIDPDYIGAYTGLVWIYTNHAIFSGTDSDFDLATKVSEKIKILAPDSADAYASMATVFIFKKKYDRAYEYIKTAVAKIPNNALTNYSFGFFFYRVGLYHRAIKYCTRAMELDPLFLHPYLTITRSLIYSGNYKKAEHYLKKVAEIYPEHPRVLDIFCRFNFVKKKYSQVQELITRLENTHPEYGNIKRWKMILYAARGERKNALALQYQNSDAFALLGLKDEALALIQKNLDKDKYYYDYLFLVNNPLYDNLRDDPRFKKIVAEARVLYEEGLRKYKD